VTVNHGSATATTDHTADATVSAPSVLVLGGFSILGFEGSLISSQTVATFRDPSGDTNPANFSADVDWTGQGFQNNVGTITYDAASDTFTVKAGGIKFFEEGSYPILVRINHNTGAPSVTVSDTAVIADPALVGTGGFTFSVAEGATVASQLSSQTLATFTDPGDPTGTVESTGDYSASINWGDGTPIGLRTLANGDITFDSNTNTFTVLGKHLYAEEGTYTITIVLHHDSAPDTTVTSTATVSDPSVVLNTGSPLTINATEGQLVNTTVATFTDPGGQEAVGEYSASVDWGDGTITPGLITLTGPNSYSVAWMHTYTEEGSQTITVTVSHGIAPVVSGVTANVTITDPSVLALGGNSWTTKEGTALSGGQVLATFTDPAGAELTGGAPTPGEYSATVDLGDGAVALPASAITYNAGSGVFTVTLDAVTAASHVFTEEGSFSVSVVISHGTSTPVTVTNTAVISDPAVVGTGGFTFIVAEGATVASQTAQTLATFTDPGDPTGTVEAQSDYSASINWGDGTAIGTRTVANGGITFSGGVFTVNGRHQYAEEGTYTITIVLHHDAAPDTTVTSTATVSDPAVTLNSPVLSLNAVRGQQFSGNVATFTDPGGQEAIGEYSASIDWGDGNTTPGLIMLTGPNSYAVSWFHTTRRMASTTFR